METDTLTIMSFLLAIFVATATLAALIVPAIRRLDKKIDDLHAGVDRKIESLQVGVDKRIEGLDEKIEGVQAKLEAKIESVQARLEAKIEGVQAELRMVERRLGDRIDTLSDRVARLEGRVFEVPLHGAGTEAD
ncbi:hypothetical protein [Candidatus Palauibacter sp.]|uniref:hypothetical protein n=1 Tax=Candidatus Palauibacter sp. TaxID=3101350 RepID=UPI003B58C576